MTPIGALITTRTAQLGIRRSELAARMGYKNLPKGMRQIDRLMHGDFGRLTEHLQALATALDVQPSIIVKAVEETKVKAAEAKAAADAAADKRWREAFEPHVIILTELTVPSQITICGLVRGERGRWIDVDVSSPRETFIRQAMDELIRRQQRWGRSDVPFFGAPLGFVVNFTPDKAVRYSLAGEAEEIRPQAFRIGHSNVLLNGRPLGSSALRDILHAGVS